MSMMMESERPMEDQQAEDGMEVSYMCVCCQGSGVGK
jgi:hypothetical protein